MAASTVIPVVHSVQPRVPQIVKQGVIPREEITQFELGALLSLRNRARQLAEQVEAAEKSVRARLEVGASVEPGEHTAALKEALRRNISWRDVSVRLAERLYGEGRGEAYCANIIEHTKASRSVSLVVL